MLGIHSIITRIIAEINLLACELESERCKVRDFNLCVNVRFSKPCQICRFTMCRHIGSYLV